MGWSIVSEELGEFVEILPPQKRVGEQWYQGTADAVYQNLYSVMRESPRYLIILSGDHVYKMDYARMLRFHDERHAAATLAAIEVPIEEASRFGIVAIDEQERVTGFQEKPKLNYLVSMGIYVVNRAVLQVVPTGRKYGFDDLMSEFLQTGRPVQIRAPGRGMSRTLESASHTRVSPTVTSCRAKTTALPAAPGLRRALTRSNAGSAPASHAAACAPNTERP